MSKAERQTAVETLTASLQESQTVVVTDFSGLNVQDMTELRRQLRQAGARYLVVKNTLAQRAIDTGAVPGMDRDLFAGPTGLVLAGSDPLPATKALTEFARAHKKPVIRAGVVEGAPVEAAYIERLGSLPSREALLGQFAGALNGILYQVVGALEALREQRQSAAS